MSVSDVAARAEARRKKILENAQKRLDKVLSKCDTQESSNCSSSDVSQVEKPVADPRPTYSKENTNVPHNAESSSLDTKLTQNTDVKKIPNINTEPRVKPTKLVTQNEHLPQEIPSPRCNSFLPNGFDFTKHLQLLENKTPSPSEELKRENRINMLFQIQYALLAIVVRLMLYWQVGWLFGEMILVPFVLTESVQISLGYVHTSQFIQVFGQVLTLCGFSSHVVQCYTKINTVLLHCIEDLSFYLVTFCLLHSYLDENFTSR
ncbi:hypothetical protein M8J75_013847 [Diaphorina citri]|nr:hypothetical protein M8J75_013847 [Diaphorina citri]